MAKAKQPVDINGIEFDALIDQTVAYEAEVPEYPTEKGFSVSDNISLNAETLSMTLYVTDTPVTWKARLGGTGRVESVVKQLQDLYFSKEVVTVTTSDEVFENMAITSISISKSADVGYAREIPISFKRIIITETNTVTIPDSYGKSGTTEASSGTASTSTSTTSTTTSTASTSSSSSSTSSTSSSSGSILYNAATSLGLI